MKKIYLLGLIMFATFTSFAVNYTSAQNGNWMNPTSWSPVGIPVPGDNAVITHTIIMDTSLAYTTGSITVSPTGVLQEDAFTRSLWLNGPNAVFDNQGTTTLTNVLLSQGTFTNSGDFNANAIANYVVANNTSSGVFNGVDSLYNNGTIDNNGVINIMTFFNDDTFNNYGTIQGLTTVVDSMYNNGTFTNHSAAILYTDSCTNAGTFTNNGTLEFNQLTNIGSFWNYNNLLFNDFTNHQLLLNTDTIVGLGDMTNRGFILNDSTYSYIDLAGSFLNSDPISVGCQLDMRAGLFNIGGSLFNFDTISGGSLTKFGRIIVQDTSFNSGLIDGRLDFCDLTPPASSPYVDINTGTVDTSGAFNVTFCEVNGITEKLTENDIVLYPNPTNGIVSIQYNEVVFIEVFNMLGEEILTTNQNQVDLTNYKNGIYLFRIKDIEGNIISQERIIKQ